MINKPPIKELCKDELKDFVLDLIKRELQNIPHDLHCRRRELCESLLLYNKETGERERIKKDVISVVSAWSVRKDQINALESLGFHVVKGKTHYKMIWNDSSYRTTLSGSPSDRRANQNHITDITRTFF